VSERVRGDALALEPILELAARSLVLLSVQTRTFLPDFLPNEGDSAGSSLIFPRRSGLTMPLLDQHGRVGAGCHAGGRGFESHHPLLSELNIPANQAFFGA
jgi:hypothetical protein